MASVFYTASTTQANGTASTADPFVAAFLEYSNNTYYNESEIDLKNIWPNENDTRKFLSKKRCPDSKIKSQITKRPLTNRRLMFPDSGYIPQIGRKRREMY